MKKYLIITADNNNGDSVTSKNVVTDKTIELIKPVVEAIKNFSPFKKHTEGMKWRHNFPSNEYIIMEGSVEKSTYAYYVESGLITDEQFSEFEEYLPCSGYGIHTIVSVEILVVSDEIKLL